MNTILAIGDDVPLSKGFLDWRAWVAKNPDMGVGKLMSRTCPHLSPREIAAYDAPFPDVRYKAGVRRFPQTCSRSPRCAKVRELSRQARDWWRDFWRGKTFMAIGMTDPVLGPAVMSDLATNIRDCPEPFEVAMRPAILFQSGAAISRAGVAGFLGAKPLTICVVAPAGIVDG